jgi:5-formyltetrahydrofolate cyclo-ligase
MKVLICLYYLRALILSPATLEIHHHLQAFEAPHVLKRQQRCYFFIVTRSSVPELSLVASPLLLLAALGIAEFGKALDLDASLKVDMVVVGSVAVDPKTGARLGKGEVSHLLGFLRLFSRVLGF